MNPNPIESSIRELVAELVREEVRRQLEATHPTSDEFETTEQVAERLGLAVITLEQWRSKGKGPAHVKMGRRVMYERAAVDQWLATNRRRGRP